MKKNEKGITLIALTVTIIVLIILASVGVTSGISTINSSKLTKFTSEMKTMQVNVNELYNNWKAEEKITLGNTEYIGNEILNIGKDLLAVQDRVNIVFKPQSESGAGITEKEGYRYFDFETLELLGIKSMQQEFFVNIKKRSVISTEGIKNKGEICYTLEQLPDGLYNVEYTPLEEMVDFDISGKYLSGGKGRIDIFNITYSGPINKWQIRYKIKGEEKWKNVEEFTGNETEIEVDKVGLYEVQVYHGEDAVSDIKEVEIRQSYM